MARSLFRGIFVVCLLGPFLLLGITASAQTPSDVKPALVSSQVARH